MEKYFHKVKDRPLKTARQVAKVITKKFNRLKERFYSNAPRIAYDTYMEMYSERPPKDDIKGKTISEELERMKQLMKDV